MDALTAVFKFVGAVVLAGGGLSVTVYYVFKHLAARWLDARFEERLQALKHAHGKELEQLRFKISTLLDRAVKLHQREFEILPETWSKLNDAFWSTRAFTASFQQYPDINRMTSQHQEEFIAGCRLWDWEKTQLREAKDKTQFYKEHIFWHNLNDSRTKAQDAYVFSVKNGIFVPDDIRAKFTVLHDLIWKALLEHQFNEEHKVVPLHTESITELNVRGEELMKELERLVHERLWPKDSVQL